MVISKFLEGAEEIDIDAVADKGVVLAYAIAEHIEQGGVHSGDASLVLPAPNIKPETFQRYVFVCMYVYTHAVCIYV